MILKIVNKSNNQIPSYETLLSAGMDVRAFIKAPIVIAPLERALINTGLYVEMERGYEIQVRPRSGLALKNGITVLNSPGTIDADYRGEIGVILINLSKEDFEIYSGDRIAQLVISKHEQAQIKEVDEITSTKRGEKGFGSTGIN
ncbi:MAG: dUTP diphosphatase [Flavobacteriaceae bacterium]|nr:dUTP diphosphatase [Flavobacteriaceae bacterium]